MLNEGTLWGYWSEHPLIWIGIFLSFHAIIGADLLLALYARFYTHDGSELNRQTGTLTIARRFRKPFVAPFYEFDPVMQLLPTGYGGHDYALWLHHRYDGTKVCLARKVHTLGLDKHNLYAFWDTLQRYMDVSQPLPDLLILFGGQKPGPTGRGLGGQPVVACGPVSGHPLGHGNAVDAQSHRHSNLRPSSQNHLNRSPPHGFQFGSRSFASHSEDVTCVSDRAQ